MCYIPMVIFNLNMDVHSNERISEYMSLGRGVILELLKLLLFLVLLFFFLMHSLFGGFWFLEYLLAANHGDDKRTNTVTERD